MCSIFTFGALDLTSYQNDIIDRTTELNETIENETELCPMMASICPDTYGTYPWSSIDQALAYYNMPMSSVHNCNVMYGGIHYSYYVQMDSYRIYVRLS